MRSIYARFKEQEKKDTGDIRHGAYVHLAEAVKHQGFSRKNLIKAFRKLMPEGEYLEEETKGLIDYLESLTKMPEEVELSPNSRSSGLQG